MQSHVIIANNTPQSIPLCLFKDTLEFCFKQITHKKECSVAAPFCKPSIQSTAKAITPTIRSSFSQDAEYCIWYCCPLIFFMKPTILPIKPEPFRNALQKYPVRGFQVLFHKGIMLSVLSYVWHFQNASIKFHPLRMSHLLHEDMLLPQKLFYHRSRVAPRILITRTALRVSRPREIAHSREMFACCIFKLRLLK